VFLRTVVHVPPHVPREEIIVGPYQERARAARRVEYLEFRYLTRGLAFEELADGMLDDAVHDEGRGVEDAPGLPDLGLLLDHSLLVVRGEGYDLAEKTFGVLPQDLHRHHGELVGALGVVESPYDPL
jgi:hypothetical protein